MLYFADDAFFTKETTSKVGPVWGSPMGGLNFEALLYIKIACSTEHAHCV